MANFTGWRFVAFPAEQRGPCGGGAADGVPHGPVRLTTALLVGHHGAREGTVYVTGYCALGAAFGELSRTRAPGGCCSNSGE